jgi:thioredoxin 2
LAEPLDVDSATFEDIERNARVPVLVDFWAAWCGPCRSVAPEVRRVASDLSGKAIVLKVDTDRHPDLAARFRVQSIPNFVVLKSGRVIHQQAGALPHTHLRKLLETTA